MKKILLVVGLIVGIMSTLCISVFAQNDAKLVFSINAAEKGKATYGKNTAQLDVEEEEGAKVLKIIPNNADPEREELILDFFNLNIDAKNLKDVRYIAVKYRYECPPSTRGAGDKMGLLMMPSGEALNAWVDINSETPIVANNWWGVVLFNVNDFATKVNPKEGNLLKQFHFYPFGKKVDPKSIPDGEVMYLGDIEFWTGYPEVYRETIENGIKEFNSEKEKIAAAEAALAAKKYEGIDMTAQPLFTLPGTYKKATYGENTAVLEETTIDGKNVLKVTPNNSNPGKNEIILDYAGLSIAGTDLQFVRYLAVNYKFECTASNRATGDKMGILMMPAAGALTKWINTNSATKIKENQWDKIIFDLNEFKTCVNTGKGATLGQFHFYPFGKGVDPKNLSANEIMYIGDFEFWGDYPGGRKFTVSFDCDIPEAAGDNPASIEANKGTEIKLPENAFLLGESQFLGWRSSYDNKLYNPGDVITVPEGHVNFNAEFDYTPEGAPEFKALNFSEYHNGIMNNAKYATIENTVFDSRDTAKIVIDPKFEDKSATIAIDGWSYAPAQIDLKEYKYLAVSYYIDGKLPEDKEGRFRIGIATNGNILTTYYGSLAHQTLKSGSWQIATFTMDATSKLNMANGNHNIRQMHIRPFGDLTVGDFPEGVTIYINQLMFFKGNPELEMHESYMKGYDGGLFKPGNTMTRAEACTIISRLTAGGDDKVPTDLTCDFTDVQTSDWYYKYVSYVRSLGFLSSYSAGEFKPDQAITRAEFVELVFKMGLLKDSGKNGVFTDVSEDYPRYQVVTAAGKAGLVNGYDNGDGTFCFKPDNTITRAEVVKVINNAYARNISIDDISSDVKFLYNDVTKDFWAYAEIAEASLPHVECNGEWICTMLNPKELLGGNARVNLEEGAKYIAELDVITKKRIEEIRNTTGTVTATGVTYYVSSSTGNDSNDGLSPEKAWKTLQKVTRSEDILKAGDAVLFKRGDLWRERVTFYGGVTYSAYGEGAKPMFYGSPENGADASKWKLVEGTEHIWEYATPMTDVGLVVLNADMEGTIWTDKEVPDLKDGEFYNRGSNFTKVFDFKVELDKNHDFFSDIRTSNNRVQTGKLYLRCEEGNPGEVYDSIEFNTANNIITVSGDNVIIDNLCIKYGGCHGIGSGSRKHLTVQNCEVGWIGGGIQYYGGPNGVVLFGNGIEIYGSAENYTINNCYVYQCYDAGITHQIDGGTGSYVMNDIAYTNNVIEDCIYNIEHFIVKSDDGTGVRKGKNVLIKDNILRRAGYGFGITRPNGNGSAHIRGVGENEYEPGTFKVINNIFDRGSNVLLTSTAAHHSWLPVYDGNTYVQVLDGVLGYHTGERMYYDCVADITIKLDLGDENAKVYFVGDEFKMKNY